MTRKKIAQREEWATDKKQTNGASVASIVLSAFKDELSVQMFKLILTGTDEREKKNIEDMRMRPILLRTIQGTTSDRLKEKLMLSSKQFYGRLSALVKAGVVMKKSKSREYRVTVYGWTVLGALNMIDKATQNFWKLQLAETLAQIKIDKDEYREIMESLIRDDDLRKIALAKP